MTDAVPTQSRCDEVTGDQDQGKPRGADRGAGETLAVSTEGARFSLQLSTGYPPPPTPTRFKSAPTAKGKV